MFEVIISSVTTGRVWRRRFEERQAADAFIDRFFASTSTRRPRQRRNFRVEVQLCPQAAAVASGPPTSAPSAA